MKTETQITEADIRKLFISGTIKEIIFNDSLVFVYLDITENFYLKDWQTSENRLIYSVRNYLDDETIRLSLRMPKIRRIKELGWLK